MIRAFYVTLLMFLFAANSVLSHALLAFGYSTLTSITNIVANLVFRVLWMTFVYPLMPEFSTIPLCFAVSWLLQTLFLTAFFSFVYYRYTRKGICKKI